MSEFKSGDKVITTTQGGWYREGEVFTLKEPYECIYCTADGWTTEEKGEWRFIHTENMKLLKQSPKDMLKNGRRVLLRNGAVFTVLDGELTRMYDDNCAVLDWTSLNNMNDNLEQPYNPDFTIMKIYEAPWVCHYFNYNVATELLWEREEKTAEQIELESLQQQALDIANRIKALQDKL